MLTGRARAALTLLEMLVAIVLSGLVGSAVLGVTLRQQRFFHAVEARSTARRTVQDGAELLRTELRSLSAASDGIDSIAPDRIAFRGIAGASVLCQIDSAATTIVIPPHDGAGPTLTSWIAEPQPGDTVLLYESTDAVDAARWHARALTSVAHGASCPTTTHLVETSAAASGLALGLSAPLPAGVGIGAPLRFVRHAEFRLYRATGERWYLGYRDCLASRETPCATIQPAAGPFDEHGIRFIYRDPTGAETTDPARVARIDLVLHAGIAPATLAEGFARGPFSDSLALTISLRNQ